MLNSSGDGQTRRWTRAREVFLIAWLREGALIRGRRVQLIVCTAFHDL